MSLPGSYGKVLEEVTCAQSLLTRAGVAGPRRGGRGGWAEEKLFLDVLLAFCGSSLSNLVCQKQKTHTKNDAWL